MSSPDDMLLDDVPVSRRRLADPRTRLAIAVAWCVVFASVAIVFGVPERREDIILWIISALIAFTIGTRPWWQAPVDWSPVIIFFMLWDYSRHLATKLGFPTHWTPGLDLDTWLGHGQALTARLQETLRPPGAGIAKWEMVTGIIYMSHFFVPFILGGFLWIRSRTVFLQYMSRFAAISAIGIACFVMVPAAPPWAAARCTAAQVSDHPNDPPCVHENIPKNIDATLMGRLQPRNPGYLPIVQRLSTRGFNEIPGLQFSQGMIATGIDSSNQMAAIPSLHAAGAMFVAAFLWRRVRWRWRPLLALYPLAMAATLVWTGDHYTLDIMSGWLIVAFVMLTGWRIDKRLLRRRGGDAEPIDAQPISSAAIVPPSSVAAPNLP